MPQRFLIPIIRGVCDKGKKREVGALPISDGRGHFIIIAEAEDANGVDLF